MKEETTRRDFLKGLSGAVAAPFVFAGLDEITSKSNKSSGNSQSGPKESDERLEWISDVWILPRARSASGDNIVGVEGWNESGLWSFYCDSSTGKVTLGFHLDYGSIPFMKYDGYEHKTLSQLRAEGTSWEEINRLHYAGFSRNPGLKFV